MRRAVGILGLFGAALGWGCTGPSLEVPEPLGTTIHVDFQPDVGEGAVARLFRARLGNVPASATPWLFRGELSDYYVRSLKHGDVPSALQERAVPLRYWHAGDDCMLQPLEWLEPDASYSLALTGVGVVLVAQTRAGAEQQSQRLFPPPGSSKHRVAVVCELDGEESFSPLPLEPGTATVLSSPGMAGQPASGCITLHVDGSLTEPAVAPPLLGTSLLEPSAWLPQASASAEKPSAACNEGEPFYGACLQVLDDRLRVTPLAQDSFFALAEPERVVLSARAGSRHLLLRGLSPATSLTFSGSVLASDGQQTSFRKTVTTAAARRHLVLNEVLANPLGPEPDAEWVELVNDSDLATSLADVWLEDSGGAVRLPTVELRAGEIALLVGDGFRDSGLDVPVPESARLLRVPSLGARGLANGGEALLLVGREGVLSRFPLLAAAHPGRSVARRTLDGADDDAAGFAEHDGVGASPGAPNVLGD